MVLRPCGVMRAETFGSETHQLARRSGPMSKVTDRLLIPTNYRPAKRLASGRNSLFNVHSGLTQNRITTEYSLSLREVAYLWRIGEMLGLMWGMFTLNVDPLPTRLSRLRRQRTNAFLRLFS